MDEELYRRMLEVDAALPVGTSDPFASPGVGRNIPSPGSFNDPQTVISPTPGPPVVPPEDQGVPILLSPIQIVSQYFPQNGSLLVFGGSGMNVIIIQLIFSQQGQSWTESYAKQGTFSDALDPAAVALANALGDVRATFMGINTFIVAARITWYASVPWNRLASTRTSRKVFFTPQKASGHTGVAYNSAFQDDGYVFSFSASQPNMKARTLTVRGLPDAGFSNGVGDISPFNQTLINAWKNFIITQGLGWIGKDPASPPKSPIYSLIVDGSGFVSVVGTTPWNSAPVGTVVPVGLSGIGQPGNLIGVWPFYIDSDLAAISAKPFAFLPWDATGFVYWNLEKFTTTSSVTYERAGTRKAGRGVDVTKGRASATKRI